MGVGYFIKHILLEFPIVVGWFMLAVLSIGTVLIFSVKGVKERWRSFSKFALLLYVMLLLTVTVIHRTNTIGNGYNFLPFWSYIEAIREGRNDLAAEMIMNVVIFIPLGVLLGLAFKDIKWKQAFIVSFGLSFCIETLQLLFNRGFAEFDDLFHNVLGSLLGFGFVPMMKQICENISKKREVVH